MWGKKQPVRHSSDRRKGLFRDRKKKGLGLIPELLVGAVQRLGCDFEKLSSGRITGLWFSGDAILPGGRQATGHCNVTECRIV